MGGSMAGFATPFLHFLLEAELELLGDSCITTGGEEKPVSLWLAQLYPLVASALWWTVRMV
jgi:hypothetical protein